MNWCAARIFQLRRTRSAEQDDVGAPGTRAVTIPRASQTNGRLPANIPHLDRFMELCPPRRPVMSYSPAGLCYRCGAEFLSASATCAVKVTWPAAPHHPRLLPGSKTPGDIARKLEPSAPAAPHYCSMPSHAAPVLPNTLNSHPSRSRSSLASAPIYSRLVHRP